MAKESFETTLKKLESIVEKLEDDTIDLDKAIALFEDGTKLARACSKDLDAAQKKVEILLKESEELFAIEPFDVDPEEDE